MSSTDATRTTWIYRGGPSEKPTLGDWKNWGADIASRWAKGGVLDKDSPKATHYDNPIVNDDKSCDGYKTTFDAIMDRINGAHQPYDPVVQNSNSVANTFLHDAGLGALPDNDGRTIAGQVIVTQ